MMQEETRSLALPLKELQLWDENARFPDKYFNKRESELIEYFCSQKVFKIDQFLEEIIEEFDLPQLEKLVVLNIDDQNIVFEGNRRLAAYKLLANPDLAPTPSLKKKLLVLKERVSIDENFEVECIVTTNREVGLRYVERKHMKGNNEVTWRDNEKAHHNARRGKASKKELLKVEITKIIKDLDIPESVKEQVLGPGFVTTFWRLLDQSPAWDHFGFFIDEHDKLSIYDSKFQEKLKVIILNVLEKKPYNGKLFSRLDKEEIGEYLRSISDEDCTQFEETMEGHTVEDLFGEKAVEVTPVNTKLNAKKVNPKSSSRSYLIPKTCILDITPPKINDIFRELREDLLLNDSRKSVPNATGVLFRVFLEISLDYYKEKKMGGGSFKSDATISVKITQIANFLEKQNLATSSQLKNIRKVGSSNGGLLSIENFHSYVHSYKTQPSPSDLKAKWDNLQEFFEILWA